MNDNCLATTHSVTRDKDEYDTADNGDHQGDGKEHVGTFTMGTQYALVLDTRKDKEACFTMHKGE